ncbi:dihydrodipicolinate synthase family protein [Jiangella asiatica]|uniref:Dihydrodipicolinate synthase family protein n=1 Tax=Jiangella asiatica TaxID=2530372 RepID=A0A4R5DRV8_9ACTN|nr:dihydrodipicolinate synthase family protein [Jiangella asiatica]TDE14980.1 dihydrodipicolinate synthase family protein [Jiangella asiatica]
MSTAADNGGWKGIFAIPVTPFRPDLEIDLDSLDRQVEFCLDGGSRGLVYPGVVSEFFSLSEDERRSAAERVIATVAGRVPVIVGVSATSAPVAAGLARHAAGAGADAVMATLPYVQHFFTPDLDYVNAYFRAVSDACGLPVVLQNARIGHAIGIDSVRRVIDANPAIRYLKEETSPSTHQLSAAVAAVGDRVDGIFAGLGGVHLMSELDRGAAGSMPAPSFVDVLSRVYDLYVDGDRAEARRRLMALGGLFTHELLYNVAVIKEILRRRGVIATTVCRTPVPSLDAVDLRELDEMLEVADLDGLAK